MDRGWPEAATRDELATEVQRLDLKRTDPAAVLLVQAIDHDAHPEDATIALDWVDLYTGDTAFDRRQVRDPSCWDHMQRELTAAAQQLRTRGHRRVHVRGAMRLGTFFITGHALAQVTGMDISYLQHGTLWSSDASRVAVRTPKQRRTHIGARPGVAVAYGVSNDPTPAVLRYLQQAALPVRELVTLLPAGGPHDQAVTGPREAVALAQELRAAVRSELDARPADTVHLFQAGPGGLALLLGHRWNRVGPTVVYEDLGAGRGYAPAFTLPS